MNADSTEVQDEFDENDEVGLEGLEKVTFLSGLAREQTPGHLLSWVFQFRQFAFLRGQSYKDQALAAVKDQVPWLHRCVESPRSGGSPILGNESLKPAGLPHLTGL